MVILIRYCSAACSFSGGINSDVEFVGGEWNNETDFLSISER